MHGGGQTKETAAQQAVAQVAAQKAADFKIRWAPHIKAFAEQAEKAGAAGSYERRHATAQAATDTAAKFSQANEAGTAVAANNGSLGSARQKLGVTAMGGDQATSTGFGAVAADQGVTDASLSGIGAAAAMGRGEAATATNGLQRVADISGRQAEADAEASLQNRMGYAGLAGKLIGGTIGFRQQSSSVQPANLAEANASNDPVGSLNRQMNWTR